MNLTKIPILNDNYVWILHNNIYCIIFDPGESKNIIRTIKKKKWILIAILLTHHHQDHIGGVMKLKKKYPSIKIYGPKEIIKYGIKDIIHTKNIHVFNRILTMYKIPGHTHDHVFYYIKPYIFCGDTLFSGGCGRSEENKYLDLYHSIKKILKFPNNSFLCYSHEYTLHNLFFSISIMPNDKEIRDYYEKVKRGFLLCPTTIFFEKKINLFLRTKDLNLKKNIGLKKFQDSFQVFLRLRLMKDLF